MAKRRKPEEEQIRGASADMAGDTTTARPDRERIARRAYELYLARGRGEGRAEEDWFSAEQELSDGGRSRGER
jgi:hypothetical protein